MDTELDLVVTQGLNAYQRGDFQTALKKFEKSLRLCPDDEAVREAAAYSANKAAKWKNAARHWLALSKIYPKRMGPINQYIAALLHANNTKTAKTFCQTAEILQETANRAAYYSFMISISLSDAQLNGAIKLANSGFKLTKKDSVALEYATVFFNHQQFAEMANWIGRVVDIKRHQAAINVLEARAFYAQRLWKEAQEAWQQVLDQQPSLEPVNARLFLARIASNMGDQKEAESQYGKVLECSPAHEEAITFSIRSQLADQNDQGALALIDAHWHILDPVRRVNFKARTSVSSNPSTGLDLYIHEIEKDPLNTALKLSYVEFLLDLQYIEMAEALIQDYKKEQSESFDFNKLHLRLMQLKPSPVDAQLKQAELTLSLQPTDILLLKTVGSLLAANNRRSDAVQHYLSAVKIAPFEAALWHDGIYHMAMGNRLEDAGKYATEAVKTLGTSNAEQLTNAAWIMMAARQTKPALTYIQQAIELEPESARAHEIAVDLRMAAGRYDLAWGHIQTIDQLVSPRRSEKVAHLGAQCIAAFRAVMPKPAEENIGAVQPVEGLFPEKLFHAIVNRSRPDSAETREGIVQVSSSLGSGGAERQVAYVMQGIMHAPHSAGPCSLVVNSLNPQTGNDFFLSEVEKTGCGVTSLDELRQDSSIRQILAQYPDHAEAVRRLAALPLDASRIAIPLFGYFVKTRPRVVHLWQDSINIGGGIAAVAAGVPQIVLCTRSTHPVEISRFRRYLAEGYRALLTYQGKVSIVNNSANGARDYENWLELPSGVISTFYNGYDFEKIRAKVSKGDRCKIRKQFSIPEKADVIGGVMRFSPEKRPDLWVKTLVAAIAQSPNTYGLIVGDGPMRSELMAKVAELNLKSRIHFVGRQSPVEPWMSAMDILFLSSITEGLPNVLIEAQSLGVPVATMNVGGAHEALQPGKTGFTLEEDTPEALASIILAAMQDSDRMQKMSRDAVKYVNSRFALDTMIGTLKSLYDGV